IARSDRGGRTALRAAYAVPEPRRSISARTAAVRLRPVAQADGPTLVHRRDVRTRGGTAICCNPCLRSWRGPYRGVSRGDGGRSSSHVGARGATPVHLSPRLPVLAPTGH